MPVLDIVGIIVSPQRESERRSTANKILSDELRRSGRKSVVNPAKFTKPARLVCLIQSMFT